MKTKAEIKDVLDNIISEQEDQLSSAESQIVHLTQTVVAKLDLDDEMQALRSTVAKLKSLSTDLEGGSADESKHAKESAPEVSALPALDGVSETDTEAKTAEGDGIVKTGVEQVVVEDKTALKKKGSVLADVDVSK